MEKVQTAMEARKAKLAKKLVELEKNVQGSTDKVSKYLLFLFYFYFFGKRKEKWPSSGKPPFLFFITFPFFFFSLFFIYFYFI